MPGGCSLLPHSKCQAAKKHLGYSFPKSYQHNHILCNTLRSLVLFQPATHATLEDAEVFNGSEMSVQRVCPTFQLEDAPLWQIVKEGHFWRSCQQFRWRGSLPLPPLLQVCAMLGKRGRRGEGNSCSSTCPGRCGNTTKLSAPWMIQRIVIPCHSPPVKTAYSSTSQSTRPCAMRA